MRELKTLAQGETSVQQLGEQQSSVAAEGTKRNRKISPAGSTLDFECFHPLHEPVEFKECFKSWCARQG